MRAIFINIALKLFWNMSRVSRHDKDIRITELRVY